MPNSRIQIVAVAGAAAVSASLVGLAALQSTSGPSAQTRAVALTAGDTEIFLPDLSTFTPSVAEGFPPVEEVLQGAETWSLANSPGVIVNLDGNDTQTTIGSFVNNDFLERGGVEGGAGAGVPLPASGSEIDVMNFGGGFQSEWANLVDDNGGHTITDTFMTPFGNYTIPLGSTAAEVAAAAPADAFSGLESSIEFNTSAAETAFGLAQTAFTAGEYPLALSEALDGFNNLTVGVSNDLLVNGYTALSGGGIYAEFVLQNPGQPTDLAVAFDSAHEFLAQAQGLLTEAVTDFGLGNTISGLTELGGVSVDSTYASDAIILGLFDSIPGMLLTS